MQSLPCRQLWTRPSQALKLDLSGPKLAFWNLMTGRLVTVSPLILHYNFY